jgi:integrase/recombinase XerD
MKEKIAEWGNYLNMTVSPRTAESYLYLLKRLEAAAPGRAAEEWTTAQLIEHLAQLRAGGIGEALTKQIVGAYRNFFGWACKDQSPARAVPYPKVHRRKQRTLDSDAALNVMAACDTSSPMGARDLAIVTLMLDSGLRSSEVCRLKLKDLDMTKRRFHVVVKGGHDEEGTFSRSTAGNLARWLAVRAQEAAPGCETVFASLGGTKPGTKLTTSGLKIIFRKLGARAGLAAFSPHDLRRTFATIAIRNGAPTRIVQAAGRWGDVRMVEHYTAAITAEDFDPYSPVESLMRREAP